MVADCAHRPAFDTDAAGGGSRAPMSEGARPAAPGSVPGTRGSAPGRALAAVLAGGAGHRLGGAKATVELAGNPLIAYPVAAALAAGLETVVVAKPGSPLPGLACPRWDEPAEPRHPLCGIVAALERAGGQPVLALACDAPFLTAPLLAWLAVYPERVALELDGSSQPLPGRYLPDDLPALAGALASGEPLRRTVEALHPRMIGADSLRRFGDPARLCFNVNTADDLETAARWLEHASRLERPSRLGRGR